MAPRSRGRPLVLMSPNEVGFGHRIRLRRIAEELSKGTSPPRIAFLVSKPPYDWLTFDAVTGWPRQTSALLGADLLLEDGKAVADLPFESIPPSYLRRRLFRASGGTIATILAPAGFGPREIWHRVRRALQSTSLVLAPWPEGLLRFPPELGLGTSSVRWVPPIMNIPSDGTAGPSSSEPTILVSTRHFEDEIVAALGRALNALGLRAAYRVARLSQFPERRENREYYATFGHATLALTQGSATAFEACYLGVPQIYVPVFEEHQILAPKLSERGICRGFPIAEIDSEDFRAHLRSVLEDEHLRVQMVERGRALVPRDGAAEAARLLRPFLER